MATEKLESKTNVKFRSLDNNSGIFSFIAGLSAGAASTVAGYIPDTIKVRLQTQSLSSPHYNGAIDCCFKMVREEGFRSLFRGMMMPLFSRAIVNGMCFSTYTLMTKVMTKSESSPSLPIVFFSGGCAGAISAIVASPTELIKVQMQLGQVSGGPISHFKHLLNDVGMKHFLMMGMFPTLVRDFICMGTFFVTTSEFSKAMSSSSINPSFIHLASLLGGAMAGVAGWAACYPFDVWKSNVQQHENLTNKDKKSLSFSNFFKQRYKLLGIRGFYSGLVPTLFRAIPVNASKYFAFDLVIRLFHSMNMTK